MRSCLRAEINVTPLVDVCLVLLIIMMVVTPLMNPQIEVPRAPEPQDWGAEPARSKVMLSYGPPVAIRVDDDPNPMGEEALATLLFAIHAQDPRREISLRHSVPQLGLGKLPPGALVHPRPLRRRRL